MPNKVNVKVFGKYSLLNRHELVILSDDGCKEYPYFGIASRQGYITRVGYWSASGKFGQHSIRWNIDKPLNTNQQ